MFPMMRDAEFAEDRIYRYSLRRVWKPENGLVNFILLNPSTADEMSDDPTIRRCIGYCDSWGYGGLIVTNLFAVRATNPEAIKTIHNPVGPENDYHLVKHAQKCNRVVCAWGNHGVYRGRDRIVVDLLFDQFRIILSYLELTRSGQPKHLLYLKASLAPRVWIPQT